MRRGWSARRKRAVVVCGICVIAAARLTAQSISGDEVLRRMEHTLFPDSYRMRMNMITNERDGRAREMELTVQYRRETGAYMEIESPPRWRGTRVLQRDDTLWMFIPRSGSRSAIRLADRDAFQGSVFSNRDIGESMYTEDYTATIVRRESVRHDDLGETTAFVIEATPLHDAAAYGRILAWVTVDEFIPVKVQYFVRAGMQTKEMRLYDIRELAGRRRPVRLEMHSLEEEGKVSIVTILELEADESLPDGIFTHDHLTR